MKVTRYIRIRQKIKFCPLNKDIKTNKSKIQTTYLWSGIESFKYKYKCIFDAFWWFVWDIIQNMKYGFSDVFRVDTAAILRKREVFES